MPIELRPPLARFAEAMERNLRKNDHKGGWDDCNRGYLDHKLLEEVFELLLARGYEPLSIVAMVVREAQAVKRHGKVQPEAADVANICMMIFDNDKGNDDDATD